MASITFTNSGGINASGTITSDGKNVLTTSDIYNGLDKLASGNALDARQGKVLDDKISDITSDTGWVDVNSDIHYRKLGRIVEISGGSYSTVISNGTLVGSLPAQVAPTYGIGFPAWSKNGVELQGGYIHEDGRIILYSTSQSQYWSFHVCYIV